MKAKTKWKLVYTTIGIGHVFVLLFPAAWVVSGFGNWNIKWLFPLWLSMDDTRLDKTRESGLAVDYEIFLDNYKFRPWGVFLWHVSRNITWNLVELFKVPKQHAQGRSQDIKVTKWITDNLEDGNGNKIVQDGPWAAGAGLKFVGKLGQDPWQVNTGEIISKKHSIIGPGEIEYESTDGWKGWRFTRCRKVKPWWLFGGERWRTTFRGMNANRYALKWKHQKISPWGTWE